MAKHVIAEGYTFTPSTKTIVINNKYVRQEQLLLITNVTRGTVIYNFSDPTLGAASYTTTAAAVTGQQATTIILNYNTGGHSSTDKLSIIVEETNESFQPSQEYMDPVNKFRTSTPQALIDTDFEYGQQATKWESISMINNRPFAYYDVTRPLNVSNVFARSPNSRVYIANVFPSVPPPQGFPFYIQDTTFAGADGLYVVDYVNVAANTIEYQGRQEYNGSAANIFTPNVTTAFSANIFSNAIIGVSNTTFNGNIITVSTAIPHGLLIGNEIAFVLSTGINAPNGSWTVATVSNNTTFSFVANAAPGGAITGGNLYVRPTGMSYHRAFDGGVIFSTNAQSHNQQFIRQTRRYFRYQSGKGIQVSTGSILKPSINVDQMTSVGATVTVTCKAAHNMSPGTSITIAGANEVAYNGTFVVTEVINPYVFKYTALSTPTSGTASGQYYFSVSSWYGASNRIGIFDHQNGIFFEFDGQTLYAVKRSSTYQLSGFCSISPGSQTITGVVYNGVSTLFSKQLTPGDSIVIKGMPYRVDSIASDTSMTITPSYRGTVPITNAIVSKTVDLRIPQSQWNLDKLDGTGPSGMTIDLTKMQMFYMDYSWYGAGFIRWGMRGGNGDVVYCHKLINNNVNYEAYMRSGNLPARYESTSIPKVTTVTSSIGQSDTIINIADPTGFPPSGTAVIRTATQYEYINYTAIAANVLTGVTRGQRGEPALSISTTANSPVISVTNTSNLQVGMYVTIPGVPENCFISNIVTNSSITLSQAAFATATVTGVISPMAMTAQTWTYSATTPIIVEHHSPFYAPAISHWGTSVIMDGRFDDDKSFVFTQGTQSGISVPANGGRAAIQSFRISPSVSNGIPGALGVREIVNRMQMVLRQIDLFANGSVLVSIVLNGTVSPGTPNWTSVGGSSLAQYINHTPGTRVDGGEVIYGFYLNTTGVATQFNTTQQDLALVRDLGTSILSGGTSTLSNVDIYPNGPDMVTIVATNIGPVVANINSRMSWTEAQA